MRSKRVPDLILTHFCVTQIGITATWKSYLQQFPVSGRISAFDASLSWKEIKAKFGSKTVHATKTHWGVTDS
jgi:hypothetical protein